MNTNQHINQKGILIPSVKNIFLICFLELWLFQWPFCSQGKTQCRHALRASRAGPPSGPHNVARLLPPRTQPSQSHWIPCSSLSSLCSPRPQCNCTSRVPCQKCPDPSTSWKIPQDLSRVSSSISSPVKPTLTHPTRFFSAERRARSSLQVLGNRLLVFFKVLLWQKGLHFVSLSHQ